MTSGWVGIDTPKPVSDLAATADGDKVTLTFTAPTESENGGYVDFENVTYRITRDSEVLNEAFTGTTYQNVVPKLGNYTYGVQAQYSTKRAATQTVKIRAGEGFPVPYSETFDQAASFDLFAIHNLSGGARTWHYNSSKKCVEYWGTSSAANHWLITPPIILEEGKTYELKFNAGLEKAIKPENYKQLNVYVGKGDTPEAQTTELFGELIKSALMEGKTAYFTAPSSGGFNFGFNVTGATDSYSIYIDNITVDEAQVIPAAVSDLKAVPAAKGALAVELSWVNPSKAVSGLDLAKLDKVEVFRGSDLVTIINTPQVGATATYTDNVSEPGKYTYTLVAYADEKNSEDATVTSAWVGPDTPAAPANAALALSDGKPVVTFDAVTAGVNGGYIDTEALGYTITRLPDEDVVAEGVKATTFTDNAVLPLAKYSYSIVAKVGEQVSEAAQTNGLVLGDALELPPPSTMPTMPLSGHSMMPTPTARLGVTAPATQPLNRASAQRLAMLLSHLHSAPCRVHTCSPTMCTATVIAMAMPTMWCLPTIATTPTPPHWRNIPTRTLHSLCTKPAPSTSPSMPQAFTTSVSSRCQPALGVSLSRM